jgi:hypothetical protein
MSHINEFIVSISKLLGIVEITTKDRFDTWGSDGVLIIEVVKNNGAKTTACVVYSEDDEPRIFNYQIDKANKELVDKVVNACANMLNISALQICTSTGIPYDLWKGHNKA